MDVLIGKINSTPYAQPLLFGLVVVIFIYLLTQKSGKSGKATKAFNYKAKLIDRKVVNHDTIILKFETPTPQGTLGIQVGEHVKIVQEIKTIEKPEGEVVERKYTPISPVTQKGSFDLLIKIYRPHVNERFPNGGQLTPWLEQLNIGNLINIEAPFGKLNYLGEGHFSYYSDSASKRINRQFNSVIMVGGGSGITPLFQIIQAVAANQNDQTKLHLLFANKEESDILLQNQLEEYQKQGIVSIKYTLDNPPKDKKWQGFSGFINLEMLQKAFPAGDSQTLVCTCGPPPMNNIIMRETLKMGYLQENQYRF